MNKRHNFRFPTMTGRYHQYRENNIEGQVKANTI